LKPAQIAALIDAYKSGGTLKELAARFGVHRVTVPAPLQRAGVALRRGGLDGLQIREAALLYEAGWSSGRLAKHFGVSADTVLGKLRERMKLAHHGVHGTSCGRSTTHTSGGHRPAVLHVDPNAGTDLRTRWQWR